MLPPRRVTPSCVAARRGTPRSVHQFAPVASPLAGAGLLVGLPLVARAQEKGGVELSGPGATRGYTFEAVVVVLLMGLALFSVCRTSRRV